MIRLADATLLEAKVNFFHHSMLQLLERINSLRGDGKDSWIVCEADLDSHGAVRWTPDATALAELFITTINTAVKRVSDTHFLMASLPIFDKYRAAELG